MNQIDPREVTLAVFAAGVSNSSDTTPEELPATTFASHLSFGDRDSYLAWVADWKATYAAAAAVIRATKVDCRARQRAGDLTASRLQAQLVRDAFTARCLLALRRAGKARSAELRAAAQEAA